MLKIVFYLAYIGAMADAPLQIDGDVDDNPDVAGTHDVAAGQHSAVAETSDSFIYNSGFEVVGEIIAGTSGDKVDDVEGADNSPIHVCLVDVRLEPAASSPRAPTDTEANPD